MSDINLDNQHSDCVSTNTARVIGQDLYAGGEAVKGKGETYLPKEKNEESEDYDRRLKRAVLDPWAEKIITARQALLFRKAHSRELPGKLKAWSEDVDLKGTPADVFFQECARLAQVEGVHWVAVDMPKRPNQGYTSAREESEAGHRPFLEHVPAGNVLDWEIGPDRRLLWAVVKESHAEPRTEPGTTPETKARWKVWTRNRWVLYEQSESKDKSSDSTYVKRDEGPNPTGTVPLIPFLGIRHSDYSGYPVTKPVFDHILAIYRKWSDMDWFERVSAHPIPIVLSPTKPEKLDATGGFWIQTSAAGGTVQVFYLEPSGGAFGSARESIRELEAKIYQIALAQAKKETAQVQSADGQREDRRIFSASLTDSSRNYESAERQCWEVMAKWVGETGRVAVDYNRDFDDKTIEAGMMSVLTTMASEAMFTKKTVVRAAVDGELIRIEDIDAEVSEAEAEANKREATRTAETLSALNSPDAPGES